MDAISILRYGYLGAAAAVLLVAFIPPLRSRLLKYGARSSSQVSLSSAEEEKQKQERKQYLASRSYVSAVLDEIADAQVPHDWFWTFYALSLSLTAFWAPECMWLRGAFYGAIKHRTRTQEMSMTFEQLKVTWLLMLMQGGRRLYESLTMVDWEEFGTGKKISMMWVGHWVLGLGFYIATSVAFWIEGIPAMQDHRLDFSDLIFRPPTFRTFFSVILFLLASGFQHDCHSYLAYLKRQPAKTPPDSGSKPENAGEYKLPSHPAFQLIICPHYTAECLIYLSLAIASAPQGAWINLTMASALVFVLINLGVTAAGTKVWYEKKFGKEAVKERWRMIPFLF